MDITLDKKSSTEALIKVTLKENDYQPNVEEKVKEYARKANIKGFRPGKVPPGLVKKMYGKGIIVEEINKILSESLSDYIKKEDLQLIGEPLPDMEKAAEIDWEHQKDFEFDYAIGMVDEFTYDVSKKQKVKSYDITLDKKTLNETLDNIKKQFGNTTNPDVSQEGDDFYGELNQKDGELSNEGLIGWEDLDKKTQKQFTGIKPGDTITFEIQKALHHHTVEHLLNISHDEAAALEGEFEFTIKNINRKEPAEMNQDFFDKVFGKDAVKNEEEFTNKVKETVEENYKRESDNFLTYSIRNYFVENTKIDIPENFLKDWLLRSNEGKITQEDVDREFDEYVKSLKWDLIKNKIAKDNDIKVENEEVVDRAKSLILQQLGGPGAAEQLKDHMDAFADNYLKGENGQNYMRTYNDVRDEKILEFIKEQITLAEKKVDVEEFKKIIEKS